MHEIKCFTWNTLLNKVKRIIVYILENQIVFNRDTRNKFAKEVACKNQAYDFIAAEKLVGRFKTFCECYPTNLYIGLTGVETLQDK